MEDIAFFLDSPQQISAAHQPYRGGDYYDSSGDDDDGDFEFAVLTTDPEHDTSNAADEVFSGGRMLPVFNGGLRRSPPPLEEENEPPRLLGPEHRAFSSDPDDLEDLPAGPYCVWAPPRSAERCPKSASTGSGSSSRRSRLMDFVTKRCHSDGKERFVFLQRSASERNPNPKAVAAEAKKDAKVKGGKGTEMDMITAHRLHYGKDRGQAAGSGRRTYLPYRQELMVGFFAHGNGLSRSHHQFV